MYGKVNAKHAYFYDNYPNEQYSFERKGTLISVLTKAYYISGVKCTCNI